MSDESPGELFWADEIKGLYHEPEKRFRFALKYLPFPAAYRHGMIALRAIIKEKRKSKQAYEEWLRELYWLAAHASFCLPYSEHATVTGFSILESIPKEVLLSLPFSYDQIGYRELPLLCKTDIAWIVSHWGEPKKHSTLNKLHIDLWRKHEEIVRNERHESMKRSAEEFVRVLQGEGLDPIEFFNRTFGR